MLLGSAALLEDGLMRTDIVIREDPPALTGVIGWASLVKRKELMLARALYMPGVLRLPPTRSVCGRGVLVGSGKVDSELARASSMRFCSAALAARLARR